MRYNPRNRLCLDRLWRRQCASCGFPAGGLSCYVRFKLMDSNFRKSSLRHVSVTLGKSLGFALEARMWTKLPYFTPKCGYPDVSLLVNLTNMFLCSIFKYIEWILEKSLARAISFLFVVIFMNQINLLILYLSNLSLCVNYESESRQGSQNLLYVL